MDILDAETIAELQPPCEQHICGLPSRYVAQTACPSCDKRGIDLFCHDHLIKWAGWIPLCWQCAVRPTLTSVEPLR